MGVGNENFETSASRLDENNLMMVLTAHHNTRDSVRGIRKKKVLRGYAARMRAQLLSSTASPLNDPRKYFKNYSTERTPSIGTTGTPASSVKLYLYCCFKSTHDTNITNDLFLIFMTGNFYCN